LSKFIRGIGLYLIIAIIAVSIVSHLYSPGKLRLKERLLF